MVAVVRVCAFVVDVFGSLIPKRCVLCALHNLADGTIIRHNHLVRPWVIRHGIGNFKSHLIRGLDISLKLVLDAEVLVASVLLVARLRVHLPDEFFFPFTS